MGEPVRYGDTIRLRHQITNKFLRSVAGVNYPHQGGQQIVVGTLSSDQSSLWKVKGAHSTGENYPRGTPVRNGDIVRLQHTTTGLYLHSHEYPSPLTSQQEITAYGGADRHDDWTFQIDGADIWEMERPIKLIHVVSKWALHSHGDRIFKDLAPGEQEVTGFTGRDERDFWVVAQADQPKTETPVSSSPIRWLEILSIVGSIASITGWTLFTIGKTLQTTTGADIGAGIIGVSVFLGFLLILWELASKIYQKTPKPNSMVLRFGIGLLLFAVGVVVLLCLLRVMIVFNNHYLSPLIKYLLNTPPP